MSYFPDFKKFLEKKFKLNSRRQFVLNGVLSPDTNLSMYDTRPHFMDTLAEYERVIGLRGNELKDIVISNSMYQLKNGKVPLAKYKEGQWIGVEIECIIPVFSEHMEENGHKNIQVKCFKTLTELLNARDMKYVDVKHDGSIETDSSEYLTHFCVELTVCFIKSSGYSRLEKLCSFLATLGAKVNGTCGLHVHLDMRGKTADDVNNEGIKLVNSLPILAKLVPKTRWDESNTYCKINSEFKLYGDNKYLAINSVSYNTHKTLEVRLHSGTINIQKIVNWIELLCTIKEYNGENMKLLTPSLINKNPTIWFMETIGLDKEIQRYYLKRELYFNNSRVTQSQMAAKSNPSSRDYNLGGLMHEREWLVNNINQPTTTNSIDDTLQPFPSVLTEESITSRANGMQYALPTPHGFAYLICDEDEGVA